MCLNLEIQRRTKVIEISPNDAVVIYFAGAVFADQNAEFHGSGRRYLPESSMLTIDHPKEALSLIVPELEN